MPGLSKLTLACVSRQVKWSRLDNRCNDLDKYAMDDWYIDNL